MQTHLETEQASREFTDSMTGFEARADDAEVGTIERVTFEGGWAVLVQGRLRKQRRVVPAWSIRTVDARNETVHLGLSREEIEESPPYDERLGLEEEQGALFELYYGGLLTGQPKAHAA